MRQWRYIALAGFLSLLVCLRLFAHSFQSLSTSEEDLVQIVRFLNTTHDDDGSSPINPTRIIRGDDPWPRHYHDKDRIKIHPGSLNMTHLEAMKYCHIDPTIYQHHWSGPRSYKSTRHSYSEKHKLLYWMIAKSGSSGAKRMLQYHFGGSYRQIPDNLHEYHKFSFIREPVSRFVSSFNEMLYRDGPWHAGTNKGCNNKYSFLFHNMKRQLDLKKFSGLGRDKYNGYTEIMRRFDRFVQVYNGRKPCNGHLRMQVPRLLQPSNGDDVALYPVDEIYSIKSWRDVWAHFAEARNVSIPEPEYHRSIKSSPSYVNSKTVSNETTRTICHLMAVDYCCLNLPLPPPCVEDEKPVYCAIVQRGQSERRLSPWRDLPPPRKGTRKGTKKA